MSGVGRTVSCSRGPAVIILPVVVVVLGVSLAIVTTTTGCARRPTRRTEKIQIANFEHALDLYLRAHGRFPSTDEGLQALVTAGLLEKGFVPKDPWGREYIYRCPGTIDPQGYDIICYGKDGKPGGEGLNADISNHTTWQEVQQGTTD